MPKKDFLDFHKAKKYARSLGLKNRSEWEYWIKTNSLPINIPRYPDGVYKNKGWKGWGDFLGTKKIANQNRTFLPFGEAKVFARSLGFEKILQWRDWAKSKNRPDNVPAYPNETYSNSGWISYPDFLGIRPSKSSKQLYRSFKLTRAFARSLKLKTITAWKEWAQSSERPTDIPPNPKISYPDDWQGWSDFLGTKIVDKRNQKFRTFSEARAFVRSLYFKSRKDWEIWKSTNLRPQDIPAYPNEKYAQEGWKGWGDFLGTGVIATRNYIYRSFEDARKFVRTLSFKNRDEWKLWIKDKKTPNDIPSEPQRVYANKGWISWGDFLGTDSIANQKRSFRPFTEARAYAQNLKLKNSSEWKKWSKTDQRPVDIPFDPQRTYANKGWINWGDFLGTENVAPRYLKFRSFETARSFIQSLNFQSKTEYIEWARSNNKPKDIPTVPENTYSNQGWNGYGDYLGINICATQDREYLSFSEARNYARSLKLKNRSGWNQWARSSERPNNIPICPDHIYQHDGWYGWEDWLDAFNGWTISNIRTFVSSLLPHLDSFSPAGLYVLFQQTGILKITSGSKGRAFVQALKTGRFPKEELEKFVRCEKSLVDEFFENSETSLDVHEAQLGDSPESPEEVLSENETIIKKDLPQVDTQGILSTLDSKLFSSLDKEAIDFFIKEAIARIWQHAFLKEDEALRQLEQYHDEGAYSQEVKRLFLRDYHGAKNLQIPPGYHFPHKPLLMQLYTAYLIKTRKRLGNWSGTGAGKTLSAILASRVIQAGLTVICCPNNVIGNWERNILEIYPESSILIKDTDVKIITSKKPKYLILNYEFFQQPKAEKKLKDLVDNNPIDFIIIDEIHYSKQREVEKISIRKATISAFLSEASTKNKDLHVLGMSATPVINNLFEGKTLIEMVTGVHHDELNTKSTVPNCIAHYQKFVSHGIRWVPQYDYRLNLRTERIDCSGYLSEIKHQSAYGSMVDLEAVLTKAKLTFILDSLRPKTIVYTHYVKDILPVLQESIENSGWRVAVFTGENKDGLDTFIDGNADVLIASCCVGTGVDRLQHVCNRLIVNSLPWTHAEFEQLKGRIYRQGQIKDHVDVLIPLTYADVNGNEWSWCDSRWKRIQFKKSVSDAAVDGVIPEGHLRTPAQAYKDTMLWLERLDRGEVYEIERRKISIPLIGEVKQNLQRRMGDLSQMNSRINHAPSSQTHKRFLDHPEEWECYHTVYREDRKSWPVVPYEEAIKWFKARPHMVIGDFGCGEALLAANVENKVFSFDHVAINENVTACDMCHTSLDDACLDAALFSLSLMGSNFFDYVKEAHRCLKLDGHLWIAEPTSRIQNVELFRDLLFRLGFDVSRIDEKWKFTFIKAIKSEREPNHQVLDASGSHLILK